MQKLLNSILNFFQITTIMLGFGSIGLAGLFKLYILQNGPIEFFQPAKLVLIGLIILAIHILISSQNSEE